MSTNYKGFDGEGFTQPSYIATFGKWNGKVVAVADGDNPNEAAFIGIKGLADRTVWLAYRTLDIRGGGVYTNAVVQLNGPMLFADGRFISGSYPKLDPARSWERHSLRLVTFTRGASDTSDTDANLPDAWLVEVSGAPAIRTRSTDSASKFHWIALDDLPDGGTITSVTVTLKGADNGTLAMTFPKYRVARFKGTGALEYLCAETDDAHVFADWETPLTKTLTITANATIDKSYTYVLIVKHANHSTTAGTAYVLDVAAFGTATRLGL